MVPLNVKTTCIYKQLFKSENSIPISNGNLNCALNLKTANNTNNNYNNISEMDHFKTTQKLKRLFGRLKLVH